MRLIKSIKQIFSLSTVFSLVFTVAAAAMFITAAAPIPPASADSAAAPSTAENGCYLEVDGSADPTAAAGAAGSTTYQLQNDSACDTNGNNPEQNCYLDNSTDTTGKYKEVSCGSISTDEVTGFKTQSDDTNPKDKHQCGSGSEAVTTTINFGCYGEACTGSGATTGADKNYCNGSNSAVLDLVFAIIRFLTDGAGLIIVLGLVIAGIQFSMSQGDPQLRSKAISRITNVVIALFVFIFAYAMLNYVIPNGFFK